MQRLRILFVFAGLAGLLAACPADRGIGPGARVEPTTPSTRQAAAEPTPAEWLETICDRVEDCAVERNVALARENGGLAADVSAARSEARQALVSGGVRRWCLMRTRQLGRPEVKRIHDCLKRTACTPFYECADFAGARLRSKPTNRHAAMR